MQNPDAGPFGKDRVHVTKLCIQTFIGELEGDGKICDDQSNAPGKQLDGNGDEVSCAKYIPRKFCHQQYFVTKTCNKVRKRLKKIKNILAAFSNWELKQSQFRPDGW